MQTLRPAVLKPGVTLDDLPGPRPGDLVDPGERPPRARTGAHLLGSAAARQEARRHRHRSDHAGHRLRVREPDDAGRALEGGRVPPSDAGLPRARARRRDVRDCRRSVCDRILARDVAGRAQGHCGRSRPRDGHHLPANNMGDIFRRNAFNLGLHVVQSPEAVADARDGDEFTFDPVSRRIANVTQGKTYDPVPLTAEGRRDPRRAAASSRIGRREFRSSVERAPEIAWADPDRARRMSTTEQIIWAHRVDKDAELEAGRDAARLRRSAAGLGRHGAVCDSHVQSDHRRQHDLTRARPPSPTITSSLPARKTTTSRRGSGGSSPSSTASGSRTTRRRATASFTSTFPNRAWSCPASSSPAPTRTRARTARTARSAWASARRRSASAGRPATSTSR